MNGGLPDPYTHFTQATLLGLYSLAHSVGVCRTPCVCHLLGLPVSKDTPVPAFTPVRSEARAVEEVYRGVRGRRSAGMVRSSLSEGGVLEWSSRGCGQASQAQSWGRAPWARAQQVCCWRNRRGWCVGGRVAAAIGKAVGVESDAGGLAVLGTGFLLRVGRSSPCLLGGEWTEGPRAEAGL